MIDATSLNENSLLEAPMRARNHSRTLSMQRPRAFGNSVWLASCLAQDTGLLLLDEPTTFLDLTHQFEVLDLLVDLNKRDERTIVLVLHDLNQACRFGDHLIAMKDGAIVAEGNPAEVITEQVVQDVFGLAVKVIPDPVAGTPMVVPIGRHTSRTEQSTPANPAAKALAASAAANGICRPSER